MGYLTELIDRMGVAVPAVELASSHTLTLRGVPAEPVLDERARAEYRARIEEMRCEIDDAEADADIERAARARAELDCFLEGLARATGLDGRSRSFQDDAERARVSVHKAVKRAVARIMESDPEVGHAISARLVTGIRCVFLAPTA